MLLRPLRLSLSNTSIHIYRARLLVLFPFHFSSFSFFLLLCPPPRLLLPLCHIPLYFVCFLSFFFSPSSTPFPSRYFFRFLSLSLSLSLSRTLPVSPQLRPIACAFPPGIYMYDETTNADYRSSRPLVTLK